MSEQEGCRLHLYVSSRKEKKEARAKQVKLVSATAESVKYPPSRAHAVYDMILMIPMGQPGGEGTAQEVAIKKKKNLNIYLLLLQLLLLFGGHIARYFCQWYAVYVSPYSLSFLCSFTFTPDAFAFVCVMSERRCE